MRTLSTSAAAGAVCVASWLVLWVAAGDIGLQRSVAVSPLTLFEVPLALVLVPGIAAAIAWAAARLTGAGRAWPLHLGVAVLVGDLFGAAVLAPALVGELEAIHAPVVFAVITALGLQPAAAMLGAWLATREVRR
jgi:hypothetical protein